MKAQTNSPARLGSGAQLPFSLSGLLLPAVPPSPSPSWHHLSRNCSVLFPFNSCYPSWHRSQPYFLRVIAQEPAVVVAQESSRDTRPVLDRNLPALFVLKLLQPVLRELRSLFLRFFVIMISDPLHGEVKWFLQQEELPRKHYPGKSQHSSSVLSWVFFGVCVCVVSILKSAVKRLQTCPGR